jgi:lauroyl/myristoyl acyltransferase
MAPYTGRFIRIINGQSEAKFGGGRYLFTDEPRNLLRGLREAFASGHGVVNICDNPAPAGEYPPVHFLGRRFHVGAGVLEMALAQSVPITMAILYPDLRGGFELRLKSVPEGQGVHEVLQEYFDFLAEIVRQHPWAWQGWQWFHALPL